MRKFFIGRWPLVLLCGSFALLLTACPPTSSLRSSSSSNNRASATAATAAASEAALPTIEPTATPTAFDTPTPLPTATATPEPLTTPDRDLATTLTDEAKTLFLQSDLAGAEAKAIDAIAADPTYLPAHFQLTDIYLFMPQMWQQALAVAENAAKLAPDDAEATAFLAWAQQGAHLFDEARTNAEAAVKLDPENAFAQQALADVLSSVYELDAAYDAAQKAVDLAPESANAWTSLGSIASSLEYPDEAGRAYEQAVELEPDFFAWHILLARLELDQTGDVEAALDLAQPALDVQPEHPFVLSFLVDADIESNQWQSAEENCLKLLAYNQPATPYPDAYSCLAGVKLLEEDNDGAETFQQLAEEIAPPQRRDITVLRMRLYNDADECDKGRELAEQWLEERPYSVVALRMIGVGYLCAEEYEKAADYFQQAFEKMPRSLADARLLANAYARDDKVTEARAVLNKVSSFTANNPLYYQALYEVQLYSGQTKEAIRSAQRWQVLRPESTEAMISLALAELFDNNAAAAQNYAQSALDAGAVSSTAYAILGESYSRAGQYDEAERYLLQALDINPDHFLARNFITQLYVITGECDKAKPHVEWLQKQAMDDEEAVARYEEYLKICRQRATATQPIDDGITDETALTEAQAALRSVGVSERGVRFAEDNTQRSLFVAYSSELAKESNEFTRQEHDVAVELARILPRISSRPDGLLLLSGAGDEPQNIFFISTRAAAQWANGELSDEEFEQTWLKESAEGLNQSE